MTLTIKLTTEQERQLRQVADTKGLLPDVLALEILSERLAQEPSSSDTIALQEWNERFVALVSEMRQLNVPPVPEDVFRRENLYDDRGL